MSNRATGARGRGSSDASAMQATKDKSGTGGGGMPVSRKRRNMLEVPPGRDNANLYSALSPSKGTAGGLDERSQDELAGSPTYAKTFAEPHNDDPHLPLYTVEQVPYYLRSNMYIKKYYRAYYTTQQCVASLFRLHNETINVWTHLLGGLVFIALGIYLFARVLIPEYKEGNGLVMKFDKGTKLFRRVKAKDGEQRTTWPFWIFGFYSFSCLMCMTCSTFFHLFLAHLSERFYNWAHAFDYFGITFLVVGSFLPFCFYVFSCEPQYRNLYIGMICALGFVGLLGPFFRKWTTDAFATKKVLFYVLFVGSGLLPITHINYLPHGAGSPYVFGLLQMMFLYGLGVFIYAFKIPEVFFPGTFDIFFSSHQIWHVCVLGAALTHFFNCVRMYVNVDQIVCEVE